MAPSEKWIQSFLGTIAVFWPEIKINPEVAGAAYSRLFNLHGVQKTEAFTAINLLIAKGERFPPNAPTIIKTILDQRVRSSGALPAPAEDAWDRLLKFAAQGLRWSQIEDEFTQNESRALRAAGGFDRVKYADLSKELPFVRKAFLDGLASLTEHSENEDRSAEVLARITAVVEQQPRISDE